MLQSMYKRQSNHLSSFLITKWKITFLDTLMMSFGQLLKDVLMSLKPPPSIPIFVKLITWTFELSWAFSISDLL